LLPALISTVLFGSPVTLPVSLPVTGEIMNTQSLYQIKETYYFRTHIPIDIRIWFGDREDFKRSLKTKSLTQARRLLRVWNYRTEEVFTLIRTGILTADQIKTLADNYNPEEATKMVDELFIPLISALPGFVEYFWIDLGGGAMISITLFESLSESIDANFEARKWVKDYLGTILSPSVSVDAGTIVAYKGNKYL
jgi:hypothetical protein